jgi:hypothetical protein
MGELSARDIIEPGYRDVLGYADNFLLKSSKYAQRSVIVRGYDSGRTGRERQNLGGGFIPGLA